MLVFVHDFSDLRLVHAGILARDASVTTFFHERESEAHANHLPPLYAGSGVSFVRAGRVGDSESSKVPVHRMGAILSYCGSLGPFLGGLYTLCRDGLQW